jgi:hypothetical protein
MTFFSTDPLQDFPAFTQVKPLANPVVYIKIWMVRLPGNDGQIIFIWKVG